MSYEMIDERTVGMISPATRDNRADEETFLCVQAFHHRKLQSLPQNLPFYDVNL